MRKLISLATLFFLFAAHNASAGQLYQWHTKDGTPTYSPDPPGKGVPYTVVGDDLEPLASQPADAIASHNKATAIPTTQVVKKNEPANPAKTIPKWTPVRYANDPVLGKVVTPKLKSGVVKPSEAKPLKSASKECLRLKQNRLIAEGQFARASNDAEMDKAILELRDHQTAYNQSCLD